MKQFINLTLFFVLIAVAAALQTGEQSFAHGSNVLEKRTDTKKCPCSFAGSIFDPFVKDASSGYARGFVSYAQDEQGCTIISGQFSKGFEDHNGTFLLVDACDNLLFDISKELDVKFTEDGGTQTFSYKFDYINLDCDSNGLLVVECKVKSYYRKRQSRSGSSMKAGSSSTASVRRLP
ncbi:13663_t:CDS:1 [Funneliformis geosporum]|uniref:18654_t:CDS:1 n=1 Tax=Funneliformis geosporum TaxID=1117311 RepID=A0A9W4SLN6_9GLOM|nr:13663_t:CDS:1 [Funneliformis geosporum]CAI2173997.1 18654_t:CDS:1 [Funneliformis geosporum]